MAGLLVGDPDCTFGELALIFEEPSISTLKITWWTSLAMRLDIPPDTWKKWQQDLLLDKLSHINVIHDILIQWRMIKSDGATLGALYKAIPNDIKQFKDFLQAKIREKAKCWDDLDVDSRNVVLETTVNFLGRKYELSSIKTMMTKENFEEIINMPEMSDYFQKSFKKEDWNFGHYQIPKPLPYYIKRKLTLQRTLNPAIFKHECTDIFVFEGIQHHHLSILARPELTDVSSDQVTKVTRRFILLDHPDDYNEITKISKHPVHRIKHKDNQFFWLSTVGSCQIIRTFLTNEVEEITENTLIKDHLLPFNNRPIAICSSPGMGKSVFLANLAYQIIDTYPQRIIIYLELRSLITKLYSTQTVIDSNKKIRILVSNSFLTPAGKKFFHEILQNPNLIFEIFLDGYDEIQAEFKLQAKQFLSCLFESKNMRVYISSRPHMKYEIESMLEVISLDIAPFTPDNQASFLCTYWILDPKITNRDKLSQFALEALKSVEFTSQGATPQTQFTGIPLQCSMLAQVYANDAKMYCNRENYHFRATISLCKLYQQFMKLKFKNIKECDRNLIKIYHWKEALTLLFPCNQEATQIVQELMRKVGTKKVPWEKIFTVGILEQAPDRPDFVHRTFAEYLLAEFIVEELLINQAMDINTSVKFIIESVLFVDETIREHTLTTNDLLNVTNFTESSKYWKTGKLNLKKLNTALISYCPDLIGEARSGNINQVLSSWILTMYANGKYEGALEFMGCGELVGNHFLKHEMVCTFLNAGLETFQTILAAKKPPRFEYNSTYLTQDRDQLKWKLFICTEHGYQFLTNTLLELYLDIPMLKNVLQIDNEMCEELLLRASHNDNVEFFQHICDTVKPIMEFNLNYLLKEFVIEEQAFVSSPLFKSISRGNYKLVEYLFNYIGDDVSELKDLWLACFYETSKDSPCVILNKVKILLRLTQFSQNLNVERLKQCFPNGVNVVLLTTLYGQCEYFPSERDVEYIAKSITNCCRDDDQFDKLVNWLLSNNLAHLLSHHRRVNICLFHEALVSNVLKPETLLLVYKEYIFDLGIIFRSVVLCKRSVAIINTIVEISGDVNFIDKDKDTLLHWAACFRKLNVIKYLLSIGANVNSRNAYGNTPLYSVFQNIESPENFHSIHDIVCLFLANKADVCARNIASLSAVDLAKANQVEMSVEEKTIVLLEKAVRQNNDVDTSFKCSTDIFKIGRFDVWHQIIKDSIKCKRFLTYVNNIVQISGNVNISNQYNITLLHEAAFFGQIEALDYLLLNGANVNLKENDGDTPLHYIFDRMGRNARNVSINTDTHWIHSCAQLFVKYNADVNAKNDEGKTPLDRALEEKDKLNIEDRTISLLIEKSQTPNEVGK